jgi:hypothetical protein
MVLLFNYINLYNSFYLLLLVEERQVHLPKEVVNYKFRSVLYILDL